MCGIGGIVGTSPGSGDLPGRLRAMQQAMAHRGPDDEGRYVSADGAVGLVNRRLAVVDPSPAGRMPMGNDAGEVWITHNGEIYNAADLRAQLRCQGFRFRSSTDTEVILHGYEAWGPDVVDRLSGMFAFGIYDGRRRAVLLARDRLGIKPLFVAAGEAGFAFASELGALRASGLLGASLSPAGVVGYLLWGSVPSPWTIYAGARALAPATVAVVDVDRPTPSPRRYWALPREVADVSWEQGVGQVRNVLHAAVRSQLVADVPLGAFLSGGLDSSAVVGLMRASTNGLIKTCSIVFDELELSEGPLARAVADRVGAEHHERVVTAADVRGELERVFRCMDQPTVDGVNTYFASKVAREHGLTVALSGLGGDELFGGYDLTFGKLPGLLSLLRGFRRVPGGSALAAATARVLPHQRWRKVGDALGRPPSLASAYLACRGLFAPTEIPALVEPDVWRRACEELEPVAEIAARAGPADGGAPGEDLRWVRRAELRTYTHDQLLRDTDVMSMAHSLEVRVPLLDHRVVETVLGLPAAPARNGRRPKALLVEAVGDLVPAIVTGRRHKQGFVLPFERWLRGPLRDLCTAVGGLEGILRPGAGPGVARAYEAGTVHWSRAWALAALHGWASTRR